MSEYSRRISYIYEYKDGQKCDNKGYIKTEIRENKGSMNIELRELGKNELAQVTIGYYLWQDGKIKVCRYKNENLADRNVSINVSFNPADVEGAALEEIDGVLIWNENNMYSAEWNEECFEPEKIQWVDSFKRIMNEENLEINQISEGIEVSDTTETKGEVEKSPVIKIQESMLKTEVKKQSEIPEFLKVKKKDSKNNVKYEKSYHMKITNWKDFFKKYDIVEPFSDDSIFGCVEIKYDDLMYLPESCQNVRNNSFLLHGLYTYNHVIVGKHRCKRRQKVYVLGVPGRYDNNQRIIAAMFGFDNFKAAQRSSVRDKNFGYWYTFFKDDSQ